MLVFVEGGKPKNPEKNPQNKDGKPTTNLTHIWRQVQESIPGHIGGRRVLSSLRHLCSPLLYLLLAYQSISKWRMMIAFLVRTDMTILRNPNTVFVGGCNKAKDENGSGAYHKLQHTSPGFIELRMVVGLYLGELISVGTYKRHKKIVWKQADKTERLLRLRRGVSPVPELSLLRALYRGWTQATLLVLQGLTPM